jgi:hypothetical protein
MSISSGLSCVPLFLMSNKLSSALMSAEMGRAVMLRSFDIDLGWRTLWPPPWRPALTDAPRCNKIAKV